MIPLIKTTIVIWTDPAITDPNEFTIEELGREADIGSAYCSHVSHELINSPATDPYWDGTEFFDPINYDEKVDYDYDEDI